MASADKGYRDKRTYFFTPTELPASPYDRQLNRELKLIQARHEHVSRRLKDFGILGGLFRHSRLQHRIVFTACAKLTNLKLVEQPLTDVRGLLSFQ